VAVSADGENIISGGRDGSVRAWDARQSAGPAPLHLGL
jgi:hypothetical protein